MPGAGRRIDHCDRLVHERLEADEPVRCVLDGAGDTMGYSGLAINSASQAATSARKPTIWDGGTGSRSGLKRGSAPLSENTETLTVDGARRAAALSSAELMDAARRLPETARTFIPGILTASQPPVGRPLAPKTGDGWNSRARIGVSTGESTPILRYGLETMGLPI